MGLSKTQKKYLRKNISRFPVSKIAADLGVPEKEIQEYLKKIWRDDKYQKFAEHTVPGLRSPFEIMPGFNFRTWFKENWKYLLLLAALVFIAYTNCLKNELLSDDIPSIKDNPDIERLRFFWVPPLFYFHSFMMAVIYKFFGANPVAHRLYNVLIHLGSVWLIYFIVSLLFEFPTALFAAGLFAVHTVLTESITWVSGGVYTQYANFLLFCFLFYILAEKRKVFFYLSILAYLLAVSSSEKAVIMPLVLFTWEVAAGKLPRNWKKTLPFFIITALISVVYIMRLQQRFYVLKTQFALQNRTENPFLHIPITVSYYLQLIFFPKDFTFYYSKTNFSYGEYAVRTISLITYFLAVAYAYWRNRAVFFWLSFFFLSLLVTLTPLRVASHMAERYMYFGSIGIFVCIAMALKKFSDVKYLKTFTYFLFFLIIAGLTARTIIRNIDWKDEEHLWTATLRVSPDSVNSHHNLGNVYFRKGQLDKAMQEYQTASQLAPTYADPYNNIACVYEAEGKINEALEAYKKAVYYNPNLWESYRGLAMIYQRQGKLDLAKQNLLEAIRSNPRQPVLYTDLAALYLSLNDKEDAKKELKAALEISPNEQRAKQLLQLIESGVNIVVQNAPPAPSANLTQPTPAPSVSVQPSPAPSVSVQPSASASINVPPQH